MYKANLGENELEILLELLKLISEIDGNVTYDEMDMIYQLKMNYGIQDYKYKNYTQYDIRRFFEDMNETDVLNILTKNGDEAVIEGIKSHLENKLKTKIDIDYNYQGAGFGFNIDKYSILTKLK